jgi:hypothetical protein
MNFSSVTSSMNNITSNKSVINLNLLLQGTWFYFTIKGIRCQVSCPTNIRNTDCYILKMVKNANLFFLGIHLVVTDFDPQITEFRTQITEFRTQNHFFNFFGPILKYFAHILTQARYHSIALSFLSPMHYWSPSRDWKIVIPGHLSEGPCFHFSETGTFR